MSDHRPGTYISPWLRTISYPLLRPTNGTRSTRALVTALSLDHLLALEVAERFLATARYPVHDSSLVQELEPVSTHPMTGEPYLDEPEEVDDVLRSRIKSAEEAIKHFRASGKEFSWGVVSELTLYLPNRERPYTDLGGIDAGIVDISLCLGLGEERVQVLIEAKGHMGAVQQAKVVEGWGSDELDQPVRYAAIWEEYDHPFSPADDPTCRVVGTIEMADHRDAWDESWSEFKGGPGAKPPKVAMSAGVSWADLKPLVTGCSEASGLASMMLP